MGLGSILFLLVGYIDCAIALHEGANYWLGYIQSPMTAGLGETFPELVDWFRDAAPVGRLGVPQDLSPTVCHLLSDAGSFISGSDILITGMLKRT